MAAGGSDAVHRQAVQYSGGLRARLQLKGFVGMRPASPRCPRVRFEDAFSSSPAAKPYARPCARPYRCPTHCRYSLDHPFLLSDNRHYPFYVWQRLLSRVCVRAGLAPAYVYCGWLVTSRLRRRKPPLWVLTYAGAAAVVLVPSPLVEPR